MKKTIAALILALPLSAFAAAATWSAVSTTDLCELPGRTWSNGNCRSVKAVCASGTCDAPTTSAQGMSLDSVAAVDVIACADSGQTITGGSITLYYWDAAVALPIKSEVLSPSGTALRCVYFTGNSPGKGIPVLSSRGRIVPTPAVTVSSGGLTIYVLATGMNGQAL